MVVEGRAGSYRLSTLCLFRYDFFFFFLPGVGMGGGGGRRGGGGDTWFEGKGFTLKSNGSKFKYGAWLTLVYLAQESSVVGKILSVHI